jgi:hypothetical protein
MLGEVGYSRTRLLSSLSSRLRTSLAMVRMTLPHSHLMKFSPRSPIRRRDRSSHRLRLVCLAGGCVAALAACGERQEARTSQVVAQVGAGEISIHQVNLVLQRQADLRPEQVEAASRTALERLIQLELTVQKAHDAKIDRDPQVVQALDLARREVLARAYIDRLADAAGKPTPQEIADFYSERPALFKTRRLAAWRRRDPASSSS